MIIIFVLFEQMIAGYQDADILRKIGLKVPKNQVSETLALILADPDFSKQMQSIKSSMATMVNERTFIDCIFNSHKNISEISENSKVIQSRDSTFCIRAINPQNIKSLTERAFFNSFNLERNVLNDLQEQTKLHRNNSYRPKQGKQNNLNQVSQSRGGRAENQEEWKCICNKIIPGLEWIQCCNQEKCRGSNWYHLQCSGLEAKDLENIKDINFICQLCKRGQMDDESGGSELRKRNKDDESGR